MFHDKKWGKLDFIPIEEDLYDISRENIRSKEDDELELKESKILFYRENSRKKEDMSILVKYMEKYWQQWWW